MTLIDLIFLIFCIRLLRVTDGAQSVVDNA